MIAILTGTYMIRADLRGADFFRAILSGADLQRANLTGAHLLLAHVGANLSGANLTDTKLFRSRSARRSAEVRPVEVGPAEVGPAEVGPAEVRLGEDRLAEIRPAEVRADGDFYRRRAREDCFTEVRPAEVGPAEFGVAEVGPAEVDPAEIRLAEIDHDVAFSPVPIVPSRNPLLQDAQLLWIGHAISPVTRWRTARADALHPPTYHNAPFIRHAPFKRCGDSWRYYHVADSAQCRPGVRPSPRRSRVTRIGF
jgi:hypothetical protein